jgi:hypothetical protein
MRDRPDLKSVSDDRLLRGLFEILKQTRHDEAELVAHISEVDARKLYAREAAPSMFAYCTEVLHLSEAEAYLRIAAARASRRHPVLLDMLAEGRLHVSGIERLAPHLTEENRDALLRRAVHKTKRQIEELVAELAPRPAAPARMRKLPPRRATDVAGASAGGPELRPDGVTPLVPGPVGAGPTGPAPDGATRTDAGAPPNGVGTAALSGPRPVRAPEAIAQDRFRLQFDLDAEFRDKLERLQALMRHKVPDGDLAEIIEVAVTKELKRLEAKRFAKTNKPRKRLAQTDTRPRSRYIPAAVRRFVERRDGGRCTYRDRHGRRCTKRHDLEFHHWEPYGRGGPHDPERISLMCKVHNALLAEQDYGKEKMARYRRSTGCVSRPAAIHAARSPSGEVRLGPR